ncbi:MAG: DUF554 family protein [Nocardioidaceae bacterium]
MFRGFGTLLNVAMVVVGSGIGILAGQRFPARTREVVTDGLGLVVFLVAALNAATVSTLGLPRRSGRRRPS